MSKKRTAINWAELRELHKKGFALHWLRPKSKAPVHGGWTSGPRLEWENFKAQYRDGYNVGVRLGEVSRVEDGYLAVIDFDVKSEEPHHLDEARTALKKAFPNLKAPDVKSGRGNGSAHFYVKVPKPTRGNETIERAAEKAKVLMPSVAPSHDESEKLSIEDLTDGYRLRPAWEISLLCEGRQVVLPGSVHPDSGELYKGNLLVPLPLLKNAPTKALTASPKGQEIGPIKFVEFDLEKLGLREDQLATIRGQLNVPDRSAALFGLCMALMKRGHDDDLITSIFTDKSLWIGRTAYDHAKTENREKAARWLKRYCLLKAREQVNTDTLDIEEIASDSELTEAVQAVAAESNRAFEEAGSWRGRLDMKPGPKGAAVEIRPTFKNGVLILSNVIGTDFLRIDTFALREFWAEDMPWGCESGDARRDEDELKLKQWLIEEWHVEYPIGLLSEVLGYFAGQNKFHPVRDYLEGLEWDGKSRVDTAFERYLGAQMPRKYIRAVSRRFFLALIGRVYQPGIKFDHLPVLEGKQGIGKSSFGRILVGEQWFMDGLPNLEDKDAALNLTGIWLCEMSELSSLYRSQLEVAKAFITRQVDKVRPPYGKKRIELPRQSVFIGTTNEREYLQDSTGNRRFWPVLIGGCDFDALARDREQLLAEALWLWDFDRDKLWLEGEAALMAEEIQESRRIEDDGDAMSLKFDQWLEASPSERSIKDITKLQLEDLFGGFPFGEFPKTATNRRLAGMVLRSNGYRKTVRRVGGKAFKLWVKE